MPAINVSEGSYKLILERKRKMEEEQEKLVATYKALDSLLGVEP